MKPHSPLCWHSTTLSCSELGYLHITHKSNTCIPYMISVKSEILDLHAIAMNAMQHRKR